MLKQKITSLMLGLLIITSMACNTECDEPTKVPLKQLSDYVSYTGYDTLRFLHNNTDTQVFIGQGINYFWVRKPAYDDTQCPEDHESLSIQFRNQQNGNTLKMEYVYDTYFWRVGGINPKVFYRFYFNDINIGENVQLVSNDSLITNKESFCYCRLKFFTNSIDSTMYLFYGVPKLDNGGILKFKIDSAHTYLIVR